MHRPIARLGAYTRVFTIHVNFIFINTLNAFQVFQLHYVCEEACMCVDIGIASNCCYINMIKKRIKQKQKVIH